MAGTDEELRLASIAALVGHHSGSDTTLAGRLAIDKQNFAARTHVIIVRNHFYSDQMPMLALLLAGPYWLLHAMGYRMESYSVLVPYLLTLIAVTLPTGGIAGLIYRMARIFELHRKWRAALAAAVVFGTGLISYSVVLNPHVPAAFLVVASVGCLIHVSASRKPQRGGAWLILSGFCAALAATIDLAAAIFLLPLLLCILTMRVRPLFRAGGIVFYLLGAAPPLLVHAAIMMHITGNLLPGSMHPELTAQYAPGYSIAEGMDPLSEAAAQDSSDNLTDDEETSGLFQNVWRFTSRILSSLLGEHGLLVHFPVVVVGFAGMFAVMHRHWPASTKVLAGISAIAILGGILVFALSQQLSATAGFGNRWLIVFLPILLFWAGAWLRNKHHAGAWLTVGLLLAFSVAVSLIGATDPMPRSGYDRYTVVGAMHNLFYPISPINPTAMAGRYPP